MNIKQKITAGKFFKISLILVFSFYLKGCFLMDDAYYEKNSVGTYHIDLNKSKIKDTIEFKSLILELKPNNEYYFSKKLPFIDQKGTWKIEGKGEVKYISLYRKDGNKDRVSVSYEDTKEITFYCYLDESNRFERIIFSKIID